jgi:hypothetical protein
VLGLRCSWCPETAPMPRILGLHALPPAAKAQHGVEVAMAARPDAAARSVLHAAAWAIENVEWPDLILLHRSDKLKNGLDRAY